MRYFLMLQKFWVSNQCKSVDIYASSCSKNFEDIFQMNGDFLGLILRLNTLLGEGGGGGVHKI